MEIQLSWGERLAEMDLKQCIPLEDTPKTTIYSAVFFNKDEFKKEGKKFKVQTDRATGKLFVCRTK